MADAGRLTIKVEADTSGLKKDLDKVKKELSESEKEAIKARRGVAKWETAAGLSGAGAVGARLYGRNRLEGMSARGFRKVMSRTALLGMARYLLPSMAVLGTGFLAAGLARRGMRRGGAGGGGVGGGVEGTLAAIYQESLKQGKTLSAIQTAAQRQADPFFRSRTELASVNRLLGLTPTAGQAFRAANVESSRQLRRQAVGAFGQTIGDMTTPVRFAFNSAVAGFAGAANRIVRGAITTGAIAARAIAYPIAKPLEMAGAIPGPDVLREHQAKAIIRRREQLQLATLQQRGPAQISQATPTIREGEGLHAFRVQRQRQQLQAEETQRWRLQVLDLLSSIRDLSAPERQQLAVEMGIVGVD